MDYYQSYEYWFENQEQLSEVSNYDEGYYAYRIFKHFVPKLNLPKTGFIVVLGSHKCVSLNLLCEMFGNDRVIGYDLYNPTQSDNVIVKDCMLLGDADDMPIAFCHNDLGNFPKTPELKLHGQKWAAKNLMVGGVMLGRNNFNSRQIDMEGLMKSYGCDNLNFASLNRDYFDLSVLSDDEIVSHMFSIRRKIV